MKKFCYMCYKTKDLRLAYVVFVLALILAACATPPLEDMNKAHDAVIRAESDTDAVTFAPTILIRARDALTRMQAEADAKRYDEAKNFADEAINSAERAIAEGRAGASRAKQEALNLISSLTDPLEETSNAVNVANGIKDIPLDFDALTAELDLAQRTFDDANQNIEDNNYPEAIAQGQTARSIISGINNQLTEAVSRKK